MAEETLKKAIELGSTNQQGYWFLADIKIVEGDIDGAIELFQRAIDLEPNLGRSHWYLSRVYKMQGQYEKALEKAKDAEIAGYKWKGDLDDIQSLAEIYDALKDDEGLVNLYQEALELHPKETELWMRLAAAFANLGENDKAREAALKAKEIDPSLESKVEQFLKELSE